MRWSQKSAKPANYLHGGLEGAAVGSAGLRATVFAGLPVYETASAGQRGRREGKRAPNGGEEVAGRLAGFAVTTLPRGLCEGNIIFSLILPSYSCSDI